MIKPTNGDNKNGHQNNLPKKKRNKRSKARKDRDKKDKKTIQTKNIQVCILLTSLKTNDYGHFTKHKSISQEDVVDPIRAAIPKIKALIL